MGFLLEGLFWGFTLSLSMGPIFVLLLHTAINKGWRAAITIASGVWVSDFVFILLNYFFLKSIDSIFNDPQIRFYIGTLGGLLLIIFGIVLIMSKPKLSEGAVSINSKSMLGFFAKGLAINTINPFTPIFWLMVASSLFSRDEAVTTLDSALFFGGILFMIILSDSLKVAFAEYLKSHLKEKHLRVVSIIAGVFLIIFGGYFIYEVI